MRQSVIRHLKRSNPEQVVHRAILQWLRAVLPHGWQVVHVANKPRSKIAGAIEKKLGAMAGFPDLMILGCVEREHYYGTIDERIGVETPVAYFLEVKSEKGRPSIEQLDLHDKLTDLGFSVSIVRSIDDTRKFCRQHGLPLREVTP